MNGTQILDAAMAVPGFPWFWKLGLGLKFGFLAVVLAAYPVGVHILSFFRKKPEQIDSQSLAEKLYDDLKDTQQTVISKNEEIEALKNIIEGLRKPQETDEEDNHAAKAEAELAKGNFDLAEAFYLKQVQKDEESANESSLKAAEAYRNAGFLAFMNNPKKAFGAYQKSVELDPNSAEGWNRLGHLQKLFGNMVAAEEAYQKVLQLKGNDKSIEAVAYGNLGNIRQTQGDLEGAEEFYNKALKIDEKLGRKEGMAAEYGNIGNIRQTQGDLEGAEEFYNKSLKIDEKLGRKEGMAIRYGNLGLIRKTQGDLEGAEEFYNKSLKIDEELGRKEGMAIRYGNLGLIRKTQGDLEGAEEYHLKSLAIEKELGRKEGMAADYGNLGNIRKIQGDLEGAEEYHLKSLAIEKELGRKEGMAADYGNLGNIRKIQGDLEGAEKFWQQSLELYKQIGAAPMIEQIQGWLDELEFKKNN
ncbi:tetratricopeptide repeat protein [Maridesulfovibrio salexigens]|uniref:TPR repeat-containing protein n=1 Tax=Maridesulfovibrio salexigens (strain ATCC 14822 / DSM 2638 / NCIMB 8403 / VKM B-1763) TaxID=526222 RepID=C6BV97_MARSD|nr:tetratricopeptide repeat protein [Maridesulfovibrio salexigens]ACS80072.1 TPR repeat-containing protein [Maridesulfovibrio salexigens DSM 2638]